MSEFHRRVNPYCPECGECLYDRCIACVCEERELWVLKPVIYDPPKLRWWQLLLPRGYWR